MGCDGGTIPKRDELCKTKKRADKKERDLELNARWTVCPISQAQLAEPLMACELGTLYSKESVLEFLLEKSIFQDGVHLRSLKDLKQLNLTKNEEAGKSKAVDGMCYLDLLVSDFICPVTGLEMNGRYKFCVLWTCGCVLSERALKEVPSDVCHKCAKPFTNDDIVLLLPEEYSTQQVNEENMKVRRERAQLERERLKQEKKKRKASEAIDSTKCASPAAVTNSVDSAFKVPFMNNGKLSLTSSTCSLSSCSSSSEPGTKKSKLDGDSSKSKKAKSSSSKDKKLLNGSAKNKDNNKKSVTDDKFKKTDVYKNLFTSSEKAKDHNGHWITYNPYHL